MWASSFAYTGILYNYATYSLPKNWLNNQQHIHTDTRDNSNTDRKLKRRWKKHKTFKCVLTGVQSENLDLTRNFDTHRCIDSSFISLINRMSHFNACCMCVCHLSIKVLTYLFTYLKCPHYFLLSTIKSILESMQA